MKYLSYLYSVVFFLCFTVEIQAQNRTLTLSMANAPVKDVLTEIQKKSGYRILFNDEVIPDNLRVSIDAKKETVEKIFEQMFASTTLTYIVHQGNLVVVTDKKYVNNNSDFFGTVVDDKKIPVSFANVLLFKGKSERPLYNTVTDLNGNFQMLRVARGDYRLLISFLGYESVDKPITISDDYRENYVLASKTVMLKTVEVKGETVHSAPNKLIYSILPQDLAGAKSALDLLKKISSIYIDPVNEKIKSGDGGQVKLLLNGTNATEIDLKSLRPNDILRLEYYDIPPARYADYKTVINVITKKREDGVAAGIDLNHAFTTGFWNDQVYFKYNHGKHQFSFDFAQYHRNYSDREYAQQYKYEFKNLNYKRMENVKDKFGYDDDYINLTYSNQEMDKYAFQVRFSPNYMNYHADGTKAIKSFVDDSLTQRNGTTWTRRNEFTPVLDIYYWKQLPGKQELAFNIVGTAFKTSNKYLNEEFQTDGTTALNDDMNQQNRKYSVIGEVSYSRPLGSGSLNMGYNITANTMNTKVLNSFDNADYNTSYLQNYTYGEFTVQKRKWMYLASMGIANRHQTTYDQKRNDWIWKPRTMIGYSFTPSHSLKFIFERDNEEPSLANLSNNRVYVTEHIIRQGNPSLRISTINDLYIRYNYSSKYLNISLTPILEYVQNPISSYFTEQGDYIVQMSENGQSSTLYGLIYSLSFKPFGTNLLTIQPQGRGFRKILKTFQIGEFRHNYFPFYYSMTLQVKNWTLNYYGNIVAKNLFGPYLNSDENNAHLSLQYTKNNWSLATCYWWIGQPSKYNSSTIPKSIVQFTSVTRIYDNKNMFTIGVSYNFNKGKKYNQKQKTLQNKDTDSGAF